MGSEGALIVGVIEIGRVRGHLKRRRKRKKKTTTMMMMRTSPSWLEDGGLDLNLRLETANYDLAQAWTGFEKRARTARLGPQRKFV